MARQARPVGRARRDARRRHDRQGRRRSARPGLRAGQGRLRGRGRDRRRRRGAGRDRPVRRATRRRRGTRSRRRGAGRRGRREARAGERSAGGRSGLASSPAPGGAAPRGPLTGPRQRSRRADVRDDVRLAAERAPVNGAKTAVRAKAQPPPPLPREAKVTPLRGPAAALVGYMEQSLDIPTATSFRTLGVATLEARRSELNAGLRAAGRAEKISFTHLIAFARREGGARVPRHRRHVPARGRRDRTRRRGHQPRHRRRRAAQGRQPLLVVPVLATPTRSTSSRSARPTRISSRVLATTNSLRTSSAARRSR